MKINPSAANNAAQSTGISSASPAERAAQAAQARKKAAPTESKVVDSGSAKTEISGRARDMAQAKSVAQSSPDVREDRIAALKAKIAEGKYQVDAQKVADKMVDEHLQTASLG